MHKHRGRRRQSDGTTNDVEAANQSEAAFIADAPIYQPGFDPSQENSFTLFIFVDCTNRQSMIAISVVSRWFHYALNEQGERDHCNRIICIPNQSTKINNTSILSNSGFYELLFDHPSRLSLVHLLNATRVPSMIVVQNSTGRIVTRYGWEAVEREGLDGGILDTWIERNVLEAKKGSDDDINDNHLGFESQVVIEWKKGHSGLPFWWQFVSWIL